MTTLDRRVWAAAVEAWAEWPAALKCAADVMQAGGWWTPPSGPKESGRMSQMVLSKMAELRKRVGVLKAKKKDGVRFKVRSADELVDRIRPAADDLGLLVYPVHAEGKGHVVDDGTLAEVTLTLRIQAVEDGSYIDVCGFGLGADNQDKAGGKAGTYAFKTALVQALLAGGSEDTDDTDTPIPGGVRRKVAAPAGLMATPSVSYDQVAAKVAEARATKSMDTLKQALTMAGGLPPDQQGKAAESIKAASAEIRGAQ